MTNSAASLPADGSAVANLNQLSVDRIHEALKGNQSPLDRNPYQPTTEQIEDDWIRKNNQTIRKNSLIPKILTTKTNLDSL